MAESIHSHRYVTLRRMLADARLNLGITQSELAKRLGRPQSFVSKYENGERDISLIDYLDICNALGIDATIIINKLLVKT
ncbi:MAG: helix-turn-helix transcriptional regulator [Betaproteobacteria bacterium]|nr:helix-turn-helix transcriptional regulator [Betaproteobacteria bacterium]